MTYTTMTNIELADAINAEQTWNLEMLEELCSRAGLEEEWEAADGETFESVAYKAAEILGVEI